MMMREYHQGNYLGLNNDNDNNNNNNNPSADWLHKDHPPPVRHYYPPPPPPLPPQLQAGELPCQSTNTTTLVKNNVTTALEAAVVAEQTLIHNNKTSLTQHDYLPPPPPPPPQLQAGEFSCQNINTTNAALEVASVTSAVDQALVAVKDITDVGQVAISNQYGTIGNSTGDNGYNVGFEQLLRLSNDIVGQRHGVVRDYRCATLANNACKEDDDGNNDSIHLQAEMAANRVIEIIRDTSPKDASLRLVYTEIVLDILLARLKNEGDNNSLDDVPMPDALEIGSNSSNSNSTAAVDDLDTCNDCTLFDEEEDDTISDTTLRPLPPTDQNSTEENNSGEGGISLSESPPLLSSSSSFPEGNETFLPPSSSPSPLSSAPLHPTSLPIQQNNNMEDTTMEDYILNELVKFEMSDDQVNDLDNKMTDEVYRSNLRKRAFEIAKNLDIINPDNPSKSAEDIGTLLCDGVERGSSGWTVGKRIRNEVGSNNKQPYEIKTLSISSRDETSHQTFEEEACQELNNELPSPLFVIQTRGSTGTKSDTTSQCVRELMALLVCVDIDLVPKNVQVCKTVFGALEIDRWSMHESSATHQLLELLVNVELDRQVILGNSEVLRIGLLPENVRFLSLAAASIHPSHIKLISAGDFALPLEKRAEIENKFSEDGKLITSTIGNQRHPANQVEVSEKDKELQAKIKRNAKETMQRFLDLKRRGLSYGKQIDEGIENGCKLEVDSDSMEAILTVYDNVKCLLFDNGGNVPSNINEKIMELIRDEYPCLLNGVKEDDGGVRSGVLLYQRSTPSTTPERIGGNPVSQCCAQESCEDLEEVGGVPVSQLSANIEAGKEFKVITNESRLIIVSDNRGRNSPGLNEKRDGSSEVQTLAKVAAAIIEGKCVAYITTTLVRTGAIEVICRILDVLCKMTGTKHIRSEEVGKDFEVVMRAINMRQDSLANRIVTRRDSVTKLRGELKPNLQHLSECLTEITSVRLNRNDHIFQEQLKKVLENKKENNAFAQRMEELRAYKEKHGHVNVKGKEDKSLYNFCGNTRHARKNPEKSKTALNDDRIASLDALGFDWAVSERQVVKSFAQRMEELRVYKEKHGHVNVKGKEDKSLYNFCGNTRRARKNPKMSKTALTDDHIASLDALGFNWFGRDGQSYYAIVNKADDNEVTRLTQLRREEKKLSEEAEYAKQAQKKAADFARLKKGKQTMFDDDIVKAVMDSDNHYTVIRDEITSRKKLIDFMLQRLNINLAFGAKRWAVVGDAIKYEVVKREAEDYITSRQSKRPRLENVGSSTKVITVTKPTKDTSLGLGISNYLQITRILPGSLFDGTELKVGDKLLSINNNEKLEISCYLSILKRMKLSLNFNNESFESYIDGPTLVSHAMDTLKEAVGELRIEISREPMC